MTSALTFQNTHFDVIEQHNQLWLSASDIANALGYKSPKSISNIYARYSDEFSQGMTLVINLMTNGINGSKRRNETRIFSLRGAHLIAMFARTEKSKEFRKWVLDILERETESAQPLPPKLPEPQTTVPSMTRVMLVIENGQTVEAKYIPHDAYVISKSRIANLIAEPGIFTMQEMAKLSEVVNKKMVEIALSACQSEAKH